MTTVPTPLEPLLWFVERLRKLPCSLRIPGLLRGDECLACAALAALNAHRAQQVRDAARGADDARGEAGDITGSSVDTGHQNPQTMRAVPASPGGGPLVGDEGLPTLARAGETWGYYDE